ncbi:amidohydrolase [Streptomyces longispororuber]|uniref:amidohydrolase n=1 Tax=Streptomyces longispororuber TaxID=68230 RepID=UPI00210DC566|nr:amidohydrolase [Streptomyces longispororuber]MCQ4206416.1 amidohydrolase [Streptomyces longispororuber]
MTLSTSPVAACPVAPGQLALPAGTPAADGLAQLLPALGELYRDLHAHPELSMHETRTAAIIAATLRAQGWKVTENVGTTGVVGVLSNGEGPTVLLRADTDGLPLAEDTGLPYASTDTAIGPDGTEVPLMHGCGHDHHVTALLGATALYAADRTGWTGTLIAVFQPGEEIAAGARAMIDDGFAERFPRPDVCLGQHVSPLPTGTVALRPGTTMAAADSFRIRLFGAGGHGSQPELTIDPIVLGAHVVTRLQTVVSREIAAQDAAVVTVGSFQAGHKENIIPDSAELKVNVRTFDPKVRERVLAAIERVVRGEAQAAGAPREPEFEPLNAFPLTVNDDSATERARDALRSVYGEQGVQHMARPLSGSEDFGVFGTTLDCPSVFWMWGSFDPKHYEDEDPSQTRPGIPGNHSPRFAPQAEQVIEYGVRGLRAVAAAFHEPGARPI